MFQFPALELFVFSPFPLKQAKIVASLEEGRRSGIRRSLAEW